MGRSLAAIVTEDEAFQRALAAFRAGNLQNAERLFKEVIRTQPRHVAALNLLGILLTQHGRFAEAETYLRLALRENANSDVTLYNYGIVLKALHQPADALERFTQALAINSAVAETWNNRGTVFNDLKRYREAIADFDRAIATNANYPDAFVNKGKALAALSLYKQSLAAYDRALALKPDLADAWLGRGNVLTELKQADNALAAYDRALALRRDLAGAWLGRGNVFYEFKRYDDAFAAYDRAVELNPDLPEAWLGRGNICTEHKRHDDALDAYDKALASKPDLAEAWYGRGNVFTELKRYDDALAAYDKALTSKPDLPEAWLGRGNIFTTLERYDDALAAYDKALASKPDLAEAWYGRGNIFTELKRYDDALAAYDKALTSKPDLAAAWLGRGNICTERKRYDDALAAYDKALTSKRDFAEAWYGRGNVFTELKRYDDAFAAYDKALTSKPTLAEAWLGHANVWTERKRYDDALAAYDRALALKPDLNQAASLRLHAKLHICDWTNLEAEVEQLLSTIGERKLSNTPFSILALPSSAADQLQCARRYGQDQPIFPRIWRGEVYAHDRIRIAYLSADFREHPVASLTVGLFEQHDKSRFEITGISFGPGQNSTMRRRIEGAFEHFVDAQCQSDPDIADLIRRLEIDIAVDLNGLTADNRHNVLARRAAPIQVNYLGYPGTMGAGYIDYIVADPTIIPDEQRAFYTEQVVWLPESYQVNDNRRPVVEHAPTRRECGLPETAFVFCSFNGSYKITPEMFDIWMRLLKEVNSSVLWLKENDAVASHNLRIEAERRGVAPERLVFAPPVPLAADHLKRLRQADLFLDTLPYNAHTTASDALWSGVPVLTCLGATFAGRVAGSVLKSVGLDELVTSSLEEYEALALKLARDPFYLASIKDRLAHNRNTFPLFNTERGTRQMESAYMTMWERYQRGEMPSPIR